MMAANLQDAGFKSYPQMSILWYADALKATVALFSSDVTGLFEDQTPNDRPVGNWLVLVDSLVSQLPATSVPEDQFNQIVEYVARMCLAGFSQLQNSLITNGQAVALLAAWNARFGS